MGKRLYIQKDSETLRIKKQKHRFEKALEYAVIEMIECGVPVLFSKELLEVFAPDLLTLNFHYEFYEEIPSILNGIDEELKYKQIVDTQYNFINKYKKDINSKFIEIIKNIFKEEV